MNNAAITRDTLLLRMKPEDWDAVIATNLTAVFRLSKACVKRMMKERRGRIVNITSIVGVTGNAGQVNYAAAKAGLLGFTKSLAKELASRAITVNAVAPGFIDTDMTRGLSEEQRAALLGQIPMGRLGTRGGCGRRGAVPGVPAGQLHHRGDPARKRRHVHAVGSRSVGRAPHAGGPIPGCREPARAVSPVKTNTRAGCGWVAHGGVFPYNTAPAAPLMVR